MYGTRGYGVCLADSTVDTASIDCHVYTSSTRIHSMVEMEEETNMDKHSNENIQVHTYIHKQTNIGTHNEQPHKNIG